MSTRPRGFITDWNPQPKTRDMVAAISAVLAEYRQQLPLTLRQIFYRLVVKQEIEKTEKGYKRLCDVTNLARRAKLIQMEHIRDDGFYESELDCFTDVDDVLTRYQRHAQSVRMDRQAGQHKRLMAWCEARGMQPMLESVCLEYGVPVVSSGGFDSLTTKQRIARELASLGHCEVLHLGDYDPSGVHMFSSLHEDIAAFTVGFDGQVEFTRLAVTPEQREQFDLPTAPPKKTDRRRFDDDATVQCEALPPDILLQLVEEAITARIDWPTYQTVLEAEQDLRQGVLQELGSIG